MSSTTPSATKNAANFDKREPPRELLGLFGARDVAAIEVEEAGTGSQRARV